MFQIDLLCVDVNKETIALIASKVGIDRDYRVFRDQARIRESSKQR